MTGETPEVHEALAVYATEAPETGRVPPGYKQTEVGVIPEDWEVRAFGEVFDFLRTTSNSRAELNISGDVRYVHYGDIHTRWNHLLDFSKESLPRIESSKVKNAALLRDGDLIFADASEDSEGIGKSVEVTNVNGVKAVAGLHTFLLRSKDRFLARSYKGYIQSHHGVRSEINRIATGLKVFGVSKNRLKSVHLPIPPLPEQHAIADALSDVDALISGLDNLIAKKRAVKTAAMQQLLTGKQRLPGFSGEWEVKRLGNLGRTYGGITGKTKVDFGQGAAKYIPFLNVMNNIVIDVDDLASVAISDSEVQNRAKKNDLFFNGSSETPEELGMCSVLLNDVQNVYLNSFCFGFRVNSESEVHSPYLAYFFRSGEGRKLLYSLAQGATRYNLSKVNFLKLGIPLPEQEEQTAIAAVLSDMDAEIAALEARREKTRRIKQGMMQELLTGRTRLV